MINLFKVRVNIYKHKRKKVILTTLRIKAKKLIQLQKFRHHHNVLLKHSRISNMFSEWKGTRLLQNRKGKINMYATILLKAID